MKKLFFGLALSSIMFSVNAQHRYHHYHYHKPNSHNVVPALIIGGILGAAVANSYERPPVVIHQHQQYYNPYDTVIINGQAYTRQIMPVDGIYREVLIRR